MTITIRSLLLLLLVSNVTHATDTQPTTTVYANANGYTLDGQGNLIRFSHLAVAAGKVVGTSSEPMSTTYPNATVVDVEGNVLLPGLIDAHGHLLGLGQNLLQVDLRDANSAQNAVDLAADFYRRNPNQQWVRGRGWNQEQWPGKAYPTAVQLDEQLKQVPVWLERVDGHAGWANSKALALAGITRDTLDPPGGQIVRDSQGNPSGVLIDNAVGLLEEHLPTESDQSLITAMTTAGKHLIALGITSMHDAGVSSTQHRLYQAMANWGELPVRVYAMIAATDPQVDDMLSAGHIARDDDMLLIRSVKAYGDGALGSRGAALLAPYEDDVHNNGLLVTAQRDLQPLFDTVIGAGFQLNFHAIGDRANRLALDQYEKTFSSKGGRDLRHRIEHAQVVHPDDIPRFKALGIIPSMQPTHATSDKNMAEKRIGKDRLRGAYAWKTFLKQGSPIAAGSDFPVELANPFFGLHAAVTRQDRDNQPEDGWISEEAMTITQAFRAFTLDAAYSGHQESVLGTLEPGKWADFILVNQDIFAIDPQDLWKTRVLETWIAGERVFNASVQ